MTITPTTWTIGTLVEYERDEAIEEFGQQLPGKHSREELLVYHIRFIEQKIVHKLGGRCEIHTHVRGRRAVDDIQRFELYTVRLPGGEGRTH